MKSKPIPQLNAIETKRFIDKIKFFAGCWTWIGPLRESGYGDVYMRNDTFRAHRVSYELFTREKIPLHLEIDHLCRNRSCVNPFHLEPVTSKVNIERGGAKDRGRIPPSCLKRYSNRCPAKKPRNGAFLHMLCRRTYYTLLLHTNQVNTTCTITSYDSCDDTDQLNDVIDYCCYLCIRDPVSDTKPT